jgi:hypothetical protein
MNFYFSLEMLRKYSFVYSRRTIVSGKVLKRTQLLSDANRLQKTKVTFYLLIMNLEVNVIICKSNKF